MYRNIFFLQMFLYYLEVSLNNCALLVNAVPVQFNYTGCKSSIKCHLYSGVIWLEVYYCAFQVFIICAFSAAHIEKEVLNSF